MGLHYWLGPLCPVKSDDNESEHINSPFLYRVFIILKHFGVNCGVVWGI